MEECRTGFLTSIEFVDAQVGRVIAALDNSPHRNNTIIVLWSDHGGHLGEKLHWRKFALWERATHVTFFVVAPGVTEQGGRSPRSVNLIDIYPTLIDLTGLPSHDGLDGVSLRPLLEQPDTEWDRPSLPPLRMAVETMRYVMMCGATFVILMDLKNCITMKLMMKSGTTWQMTADITKLSIGFQT